MRSVYMAKREMRVVDVVEQVKPSRRRVPIREGPKRWMGQRW
jgi:hypothetical protein